MSRAAELFRVIEDAVDRGAKADAALATGELRRTAIEGVTAVQAEVPLKKVIGRRWFDLAAQLGERIAPAFPASPGIGRRYGQSLIEVGQLARARAHFETLLATPQLKPSDRDEYIGFIGRTLKQQVIVEERLTGNLNADTLRRAIDTYLEGYRADETANTWHGINAVALLRFAQRRGVQDPRISDASAMADAIAGTIGLLDARKYWDEATLAEAHVALEQWDEAEQRLKAYLWDYRDANAFAFGSTLRQLEEIWGLGDEGGPGSPLVVLLHSRLMEIEDGSVTLSPGQIARGLQKGAMHYEKVFGKDHFTSLRNYRLGLERCGPVARVGYEAGTSEGTGFLLRASDLLQGLDGIVLVTNAHVIDPTPDRKSHGLAPHEAVVSFQALDGVGPADPFKIDSVVFSSPREALDVTIVRLTPMPPLERPYPLAAQMPNRGARLNAIGHPGGGSLQLSLNDNELLDFEDAGPRVHYRTPTEGGSSGSPIFTKEWELVSLHHAGGDDMARLNGQAGTYQANEGISFTAIRAGLAAATAGARG